MREIKFRVYDKDLNAIIPASQLILDDNGMVTAIRMMNDKSFHVLTEKNLVLVQFTGLKDKNGKEIYEGDICLLPDTYTDRILDDGTGPVEPANHLATVVFMGGSFGLLVGEHGDIFGRGFHSFEHIEQELGKLDIEVIGNVYENPELLTT